MVNRMQSHSKPKPQLTSPPITKELSKIKQPISPARALMRSVGWFGCSGLCLDVPERRSDILSVHLRFRNNLVSPLSFT